MSKAGLPARPTEPPAPAPSAARTVTGIRRLDAELGAAAPARLVFLHEPGLDAAAFLLHAACGSGGPVVYAVTARAPEAVHAERERLGDAVARARVTVVDLRGAADPQEASRRVAAADPAGTATFALEGLSSLVQAWGPERATDWYRATRATDRRVLLVLSDRALAPAARDALLEDDPVVRLSRRELLGVRYETFQVRRPAAGATERAYPYRVERPGGVQAVLPKILVTGAYSAGKSTLVHTLSETGVNVEHLGTTVSLDHGRVDRDGLTVDLFGTPGQERFDPIIRQIGHGALGILAVVDSTRPSTFHRSRALVDEISAGRVPVVYAANKQDAPGALDPEAIRRGLGLGERVPVLACRAAERASALTVLDALIERVVAALAVPPAAPAS